MKTIIRLFGKSLLIASFLLSVQAGKVYSQSGWIKTSRYEYGARLSQLINGSGHGMLTDFELLFKKGYGEVSAGVFTQSKFKKLSGFSFQYKYQITQNKFNNLYAHSTFMYHYQNCLNDNLNKLSHPQDYTNCCEFEKFNTLVGQLGIGIEGALTKRLYLDLKIGIGGYFSCIQGEDNRNKNIVGRDDNGFSFMSGLGLSYKIKAKDKKSKFGKY